MNSNWAFLPHQLGIFTAATIACSQLLAGAIVVNDHREAVTLNTVEIYGRDRTVDIHRERCAVAKGTSLPTNDTRYPNVWATILSTIEGRKLTIGGKAHQHCNIGTVHPATVGGKTTSFDLE